MTERSMAFRVTGRVQGVWFRGWTQAEANRLGLSGWVRNEADGAVTGLVAGPAEAVGTFLRALETGPAAARVASVTAEPSEAAPGAGFRVLR